MKSTKKASTKATMKKAMKVVKKAATKPKAMKKRASNIAHGKYAKASVFRGSKEKTGGGLKKSQLMKNKQGKVVSRRSHAAGKKAYKNVQKYANAVKAARKALGIKGFVPVGGKTAKGQALWKKAKSLYKK